MIVSIKMILKSYDTPTKLRVLYSCPVQTTLHSCFFFNFSNLLVFNGKAVVTINLIIDYQDYILWFL